MGSSTGVMLSLAKRFQLGLCVAALVAAQAAAAQPKWLGEYKKWSAYVVADGEGRICYAHSEPSKQAGKYTKRGEVFLQVTHRTASSVRNEVGLTAGYTYKQDSDVEVDIDGTKFSLFTDKDGAWARDSKTDTALVRAMIKGRQLVVRGQSRRGTLTTDTYSLSGFTAAYRAIGRACPAE